MIVCFALYTQETNTENKSKGIEHSWGFLGSVILVIFLLL